MIDSPLDMLAYADWPDVEAAVDRITDAVDTPEPVAV